MRMNPESATPVAASHVMNTYANLPVYFARGKGRVVVGRTGSQVSRRARPASRSTRWATTHPRLVAAIADQASKIIHSVQRLQGPPAGNSWPTSWPRCRAWTRSSSATRAWKPTRPRSRSRASTATIAASRCPKIIVYEHAFHGRSIATLSATGNAKVQKGFEPLVPGFVRVPHQRRTRRSKHAADRASQRRRGVPRGHPGRRRRDAGPC